MTERVDQFIFTNLVVYKAIADEAYEKMVHLIESGRYSQPNRS